MGAMARLTLRRPRLVIAVWVLALAAAVIPARSLQGRVANSGYDAPGSQSYEVSQLTAANFDHGQRQLLYAVVRGRNVFTRVWNVVMHIRDRPDLAGVRLYAPHIGSRLAMLPFTVAGDIGAVQKRMPELLLSIRRVDSGAQLLGQAAIWHESTRIAQQDLSRGEALALPATLALLVVAFLSVVAAGVPIALALVALIVTFGALSLLTLVGDMSVYVTNTASVLGLGLAIDYSLFIVTRYRELVAETGDREAALYKTMTTTGYAIFFSGVTVALALSTLTVMGLGVFSSMALGASLATAIAALGALTLLPAILRLLGPRIDQLRLRPAARAARSGRLWQSIARAVLRRPVLILSSSVALLILCALPFYGTQLTSGNTTFHLPPGDALRTLSDDTQRALGPGILNPVEIVTNGPPGVIARQVRAIHGIVKLSSPLSADHGWSGIIAQPSSPATTPAARRLVLELRAKLVAPPGRAVYVGGETAQGLDLIDRTQTRFPWMILVASILSFGLLLIAFRSIVIPLKAVVTNLLSVSATLGLVALIFDRIGGGDGIAWFVPPFLFAIVFGLSMDYEIFLISRVREEHLDGADNAQAVTRALIRNGRPITLAAAVMMVVFIALALGRLEMFRQLGVGMAIAVFLDATVVRCALVPSALVLLGERNWWLPRGLGWLRSPHRTTAHRVVGEL